MVGWIDANRVATFVVKVRALKVEFDVDGEFIGVLGG